MSVDESSTRERVACRVRTTAREKGVTKANLRDALNLSDWRAIKGRWDGHIDYTVPQLAAVAARLGVTPSTLIDGADETDESRDE